MVVQAGKARTTIHIGHGKTGSSAIQSYLAQAEQCMLEYGITYPYHKSLTWAKEGEISSGNGRLLLESKLQPTSSHDLFSDETLCARLTEIQLENICKAYPGGVKVIAYTRDFFDHAVSAWGQNIKRSGYEHNIEPFLKNMYGGHLKHLKKWLDIQDRLGFSLEIFNYSRHKLDLVPHFMVAALGNTGRSILEASPARNIIVNRSLTLGEYELQRLMNVYFPKKTSTFVSDVLVNALPNIEAERPVIPKHLYELSEEKFMLDIEAINARLTSSEKIIFEPFETLHGSSSLTNANTFRFSQEQLEVYVKSLAGAVVQPDIGRLERMAASYGNGEVIDRSDAKYLVSVLRLMRPGNPNYAQLGAELATREEKNRWAKIHTLLSHLKRLFKMDAR